MNDIISEDEIQNFEDFFANVKLPDVPFELKQGETIVDMKRFIDGHIAVVRNQKANAWIMPYIDRLEELREKIKEINKV